MVRGQEEFSPKEEDFRLLAESLPQIVWITNPEGLNIYFNNKWREYTGLTFEESYGTGWVKPFHPDDRGRAWNAWSEATQRRAVYSLECRLRRADGAYQWWLIRGVPCVDSKGQVLKWFGTCTDIHELKNAELAVRESRALLRNIIDSTPSNIFALDLDQAFVLLNDAMAKFYGLPKGDVLGKKPSEVFSQEIAQRFYQKNAQVIRTGDAQFEEEEVAVRGESKPRVLLSSRFALRNEEGKVTGLAGVATEITRLRQAEAAAAEAAAVAESARNRMKFLDVAAHELRTPVTALSILLELATRQAARGNPPDSKILDRLREPVERLTRLVLELLDVSRLERGVVGLQRVRTDLTRLVVESVREFQLVAPDRHLICSVPAAPIEMDVDPMKIRQVLLNLLDNAHKYSMIQGSIEVKVESFGRSVRVSVIDQGPGIPPQQLADLFQPFVRGRSDDVTRAGGLGLGLSVCRGLVELHGGTIDVLTGERCGSVFYFDLPKDEDHHDQENTHS